ncbi:hypothetical protein F4604DRAFT_1866788, partial [Suillus subluteus]
SCTTLLAFSVYVGGIILFCAETLFLWRVWAVMGGRWLTMCGNLVLFLIPVTVALTLSNSSSTVMQSPIPKVTSCYDGTRGHIIILAYALLVIVEIEILSFMLYHSWKYYRQHGNDMPLVRVLIKHNIFYFACGLVFSTAVVVVVVILPFVIHGILATRMHRELYDTAHPIEETSTGNVSLPLVFAPALSENLEMQPRSFSSS